MSVFYTKNDPTFTWADVKPTHPLLSDQQKLYSQASLLWKKANELIDLDPSSTSAVWNVVRKYQELACDYEDASNGKLSEQKVQELLRGIIDE